MPPVYIFLLVVLLLLLYFFHLTIIKYFSLLSFLTLGTNKAGLYFYFLFFLPGVILHELAHLLTASILGVPTGRLTIFPQKTDEGWTLGQVASGETDIFRSNLIGLAPMVVGTASLLVIVNLGLEIKNLANLANLTISLKNILLLYLMLVFANTMFLSSEDRTSIWAFPSLLVVLFLFGKVMGWAGVLTAVENLFYQTLRPLILGFGLTAIVDSLFLLPLVIMVKLLLRIRE